MVMLASTNVFTAGPDPPGPDGIVAVAGFVSRVNETPPTVNVTAALPVTVPFEFDVKVTEQVPPEVPGLAQVFVLIWLFAPLASLRVTVGLVPFGTLTKLPPVPLFCLTVTVKVCGCPTSFV